MFVWIFHHGRRIGVVWFDVYIGMRAIRLRFILEFGLCINRGVTVSFFRYGVCRFVVHAVITSFYVLDCVPYHGFYLLRLTKRYKNGSFWTERGVCTLCSTPCVMVCDTSRYAVRHAWWYVIRHAMQYVVRDGMWYVTRYATLCYMLYDM